MRFKTTKSSMSKVTQLILKQAKKCPPRVVMNWRTSTWSWIAQHTNTR